MQIEMNKQIKAKRTNLKLIGIIILVICFLLVINTFFVVIPTLHKSTLVHDSDSDGIRNFYLERQDSLDGIYIGPSSVYRFWFPPQAYEDTGMAVYALASNNMPVSTMEHVLKDAVKRQSNIKFVAIDLRNISKVDDGIKSRYMKRLTDVMPWSIQRTDAINAYLDYCKNIDTNYVDFSHKNYYFPFVRDRGAWLKDVNKDDLLHYFRNDLNLSIKGCRPRIDYVYNEPFSKHTEGIQLMECQIDVLNSLFSYCRELENKGISVVFTFAPCNTGGEKSAYLHQTAKLCKENGFRVLDFNDEKW